jgi:hypothetical protein
LVFTFPQSLCRISRSCVSVAVARRIRQSKDANRTNSRSTAA